MADPARSGTAAGLDSAHFCALLFVHAVSRHFVVLGIPTALEASLCSKADISLKGGLQAH